MTKKEKQIAILLQGYDKKHLSNLLKQKKVIDTIYNEMAREAARIGEASGFDDPEKEFSFDDFPATKKRIDELIESFADKLDTTIQEGSKQEWLLSEAKNKQMINMLAKGTGISKEIVEGWTRPHLDALQAFQQRKTNGMNLSDRVWQLGQVTKSQLEMALDIGLGEGKSAADLSRDVRQYLKEPNKLFRRVRDKHGNLRLSKNAEAYHPGQGVYRSSYKNALRLTATENNMAYRVSDHDKWNELDFVIGIEISLSNNHTLNGKPFIDVCNDMVGKYPKEFKFTGWHPFCRCFATPILADWDEQLKVMRMRDNGEDVSDYHYQGEITDMPEGYNEWMEKNAERIANAKNPPIFVRDNYVDGDVSNGFSWEKKEEEEVITPSVAPQELTIEERAEIRHNARTPEYIEDLNRRIEERQKVQDAITTIKEYKHEPIELLPSVSEFDNMSYDERYRLASLVLDMNGYKFSMSKPTDYSLKLQYSSYLDKCNKKIVSVNKSRTFSKISKIDVVHTHGNALQQMAQYIENIKKNTALGDAVFVKNELKGIDNLTKLIKADVDFTKISANMPFELLPGSDLLQKDDYTFDKRLFDRLGRYVPLDTKANGKSGYFSGGSESFVHIDFSKQRMIDSAYERKCVVYHEYGHANHYTNDMDFNADVQVLMDKHSKALLADKKKLEELDIKLGEIYYDNKGNRDEQEKVMSVMDVVQSLTNGQYGRCDIDGHSKSYWKTKKMPQCEYVAHMSEFFFYGNDTMKDLLPELYKDMAKLHPYH